MLLYWCFFTLFTFSKLVDLLMVLLKATKLVSIKFNHLQNRDLHTVTHKSKSATREHVFIIVATVKSKKRPETTDHLHF